MIRGKEEAKTQFKLFTGLADVNVISFNPNYTTLKEYFGGSDKTKEPVYSSEGEIKNKDQEVIGSCQKLRLDIWVENKELGISKFKSSIFLEDRLTPESNNKPGNFQWINDVGQTIWMNEAHDNISEIQQKMFDVTRNPRRTHVGEDNLYHFLQRWSRIDQKASDSELKMNTSWTDLVNGDVSELNEYITQLEGHKVRVQLGVQDNKYQQFFTKYVLKEGDTYIDKLKEQISKWKCNYQGSFEFKVFDNTKDMPTTAKTSQASAEEVAKALNV